LGDTLDAQEWIGGALITGGVLAAELLRRPSSAQ
jgi:drug/metabolite transporter (DMT)-like permease